MKISSLPFIFILFIGMILYNCRSENAPGVNLKDGNSHSLSDELKIFYDISSLPLYRDSTFSAQVSSYDTTWGNDDGFSGRYSYISRNADSTLLLFDIRGGGVINRIWTPTPTTDTLDFFIDDNHRAAFSVCYTDLFSGRVFPFTEPLCGNQLGGYYCYLPIPFEKSCRIISRGKKEQFHQIQYRLYKPGDKIKSFNINLDAEEREALGKIRNLWDREKRSVKDFHTENLSYASKQIKMEPGEVITVFNTDKGGRILGLELSPADAFEGLMKNTDIRITWDGEKIPSVYCPVADFFGYAFGSVSMQSLILGSNDNRTYCYFPMPFDRSAKIELIQRETETDKPQESGIKAEIWYTNNKRDPAREGKFRAHWEKGVSEKPGAPHIFADIKGKGHYVGTLLQSQGLKAGMTIFFEGDDSTSIDGSFRVHGTGSEDYFNGGWYAMMDRWDDKMSLPLHGSLGYSLPFARTGGYRIYLTDKLSFEKSFYQSIEHGPVKNNFPSDYTSLGLYYSDTTEDKIIKPTNEFSKVHIPDTLILYPQLTDFTLFGKMDVNTTWKYGTGGESYLFAPGPESWLRLSLREIPEGNYALYFDIMKEPTGCDFSLWQRQKSISGWIPSYNIKEERAENLFVCDMSLPETYKTLTLRFRTDKQKKDLLLNRILLIRK